MYIISHRGYHNDNRFMGILRSLSCGDDIRWSEIDLLWVGNEWIVCHDFTQKKKYRYHDALKDLLPYLCHLRLGWRLLLDVKWDVIYNRQHNEMEALSALSVLLSEHVNEDIWLQFSFDNHIDMARHDPVLSKFRTGLLLCDDRPLRDNIDFIDIDVSRFTESWIDNVRRLYPDIKIIGFTCHHPKDIQLYKHLFDYLYALVCDHQYKWKHVK